MANDVLQGVKEDVDQITKSITDARDLISAMKEAGESTAEFEQELRTLEIRKEKWARMLKNRGIT